MSDTALVTGANRGIGLELCRQLSQRGDTVVGVCRQSSPELAALDVRIETGVDVTDDVSVRALVERLGDSAGDRSVDAPVESLDILFNNAGILSRESLEDLDFDRIRQQFEVNALGPLRVTAALRELFVDGSKVGIVTSRMGSIEDNTSGSRYGYRMSKAAVNMAGRSLAHDLVSEGVAVVLLHPGYVRTDMTGGSGYVDPDEAASGLIDRIDELTMETSGTFWHAKGEPLPW